MAGAELAGAVYRGDLRAGAVWENFQRFPLLYQRVRIDTVQIKKGQPELFRARLQKLVDNTRQGIMYGEWNDNGRLIDY